MTNKLKNIISNLIGLGVIGLGAYMYLNNGNLHNFLTLLGVGLSCFLFKVSETKSWLSRFLFRFSREKSVEVLDTIGDGSNPDKEQK